MIVNIVVINVKFIFNLNKLKIVMMINMLCNNVSIEDRFICYLNFSEI